MNADEPRSVLEQISTRWSLVTDPLQFVLRYGPAIRAYVAALVPDPHDAEDVTQDFLLRMVRQAVLIPERVQTGRFRDYLKAALRNAAIDHFRKKRRAPAELTEDLIPAAREEQGDSAWDLEWRQVLLDRCWELLEAREREGADNFGYTALKLAVEFPDEESPALAARLGAKAGRPFTPEAFRKQLSRARKAFAQSLVDEVRQTLESPSAAAVVRELTDLGLLEYVRDYLPAQWKPG